MRLLWLNCWFLELACPLSFLASDCFSFHAVFIGSLLTWRGRRNLKSAYSNTTYLVPDEKWANVRRNLESARSGTNYLIPEYELEECRRSFQWF
ncbi:hypothetical protein EV401DRAFT_1951199 [Pisolithus croceorrhizus]|nr:hypothetical protein EV401DRAFT_1951199 [Pisolithus croceorrhizus]